MAARALNDAWKRIDFAGAGTINKNDLPRLLRDANLQSALKDAQSYFVSYPSRLQKNDVMVWYRNFDSSSKKQETDMAEQIFMQILGSADAEANIKQFATAVEKLGYDWDAQILRDVFDRIDHSGDGQIDLEEFKQGIALVAATQMFKDMDKDSSGTIEFEEFQAVGGNLNPDWSTVKIREVFNEVDIDNSGTLELLEFLDAINKMHNTGQGGLMALGFERALGNQMRDLKNKIQQVEAKMNGLKDSMVDNEKLKGETDAYYKQQKGQARNAQADHEKLEARMGPAKGDLDNMIAKMGPLGEQLEENIAEFAAKENELQEIFGRKEWNKIPPLADELVEMQKTIKELESKLGITREQHNALLGKYEELSTMHKASAGELAKMHAGVDDAQGALDAAIAAHADDLENWKATSAEYKQLKRNLLKCQVKEKKALIANCLGELNKALAKHRKASGNLAELQEQFQKAEDEDDWETTGPIGDKLSLNFSNLQESDRERHIHAEKLKGLRKDLSEEKKGLAALDA